MGIYKDIGIVNGKLKYVIVDGHRKIINRYPTKEELNSIVKWNFKHNETETCYRCGISFDDISGHPLREEDTDGNKTGRWICYNCYWIRYRENKSGIAYLRRQLADCRTGNQDPNFNHAKSDNFEELTHRRKGVKILSIENDCRNGPLDHSVDSEGKIFQTNGRWYSSIYRTWCFGGLDREWDKIFDYEICYCISEDGKNVERIYEIPFIEEIKDKRKSITITKYDINGKLYTKGWYKKYRILDKEEFKIANKIWKEIVNRK